MSNWVDYADYVALRDHASAYFTEIETSSSLNCLDGTTLSPFSCTPN